MLTPDELDAIRGAAANGFVMSQSIIAHIDGQAAELDEWHKLKDPNVLHINLLAGIPARLPAETLLHLACDQYQGMAARIAELEQDAARYAALRHALINVDPKGNRGPIEMAIKNLIRQVHAERGVTEPTEDEFDAAIDAAMSTQAATERP